MILKYIAPIGLFDDWAHTVQIMKMCEAFSQNGVEVELLVPNRTTSNNGIDPKVADPFQYNHVSKSFKITKLPFIDMFYSNPSPLLYRIRLYSFLVSVRVYLLFTSYDIVYTREIFAGLFFNKSYLELHSFPNNLTYIKEQLLKRARGIIVLTSFIKSKIEKVDIAVNKILVSPDGVRIEDFLATVSKADARQKLRLSQDDYLFGYIGTLKTMGMEKGVVTAIGSLKFLPEKYKLYVVGGEPADVDFYKQLAENESVSDRVLFTGRVAHKSIPTHISACDVVVAPFPRNTHYEYYMSPLKIFEYMAGRRPMVVTNLASLREVLQDNVTALLIEPEDAQQLAEAVEKLVSNPELSNKISVTAFNEMEENYTWKKRAHNILNFIHI